MSTTRDICPSKAFGFEKSLRLLNAEEYKAVFDNNSFRTSHKSALILARRNQQQKGRLGLVVGKKNVRRAVDRNRIKRITREQFRLNSTLVSGLDIVVMAKQGIAELSNKALGLLVRSQLENIHQQQKRE